jgi:hypothetical protein
MRPRLPAIKPLFSLILIPNQITCVLPSFCHECQKFERPGKIGQCLSLIVAVSRA